MKAETEIFLPTGIKIGEKMRVFADAIGREATVTAKIAHVERDALGTQIRVVLEIDADVIASFDHPPSPGGGIGTPAVYVRFKPEVKP